MAQKLRAGLGLAAPAGHEVAALTGPAHKPMLRWSIRLHRTEAGSNGEDDASFTLSGSAGLGYGSTGPLDYGHSTLRQDARRVSVNIPAGSFGAVGACGQSPPDPFGTCSVSSELVSTHPGTLVVGPVYRAPNGNITQVRLRFGQRPAEVVRPKCTGDCGKLPGTVSESLADETLRAIYDPQDKGYFSISGFKENPDGSVVARQSVVKSQFPNKYSINATWTTCAQPRITLPAAIRDPDTPPGMADRIPPRIVTTIPVRVDVPSCAGAAYLTVAGQPGDGKVVINGQDKFALKPGKYKLNVQLRGKAANPRRPRAPARPYGQGRFRRPARAGKNQQICRFRYSCQLHRQLCCSHSGGKGARRRGAWDGGPRHVELRQRRNHRPP